MDEKWEVNENEFIPHFKFWPDQTQKGVPYSCCQSFFLGEENSSSIGSWKNNFNGKREEWGEGVKMQVYLQGREKALEAMESAMPGLLEEP